MTTNQQCNIIQTGKLFSDSHPNKNRDWVIGDFIANPVLQTDKFEFKWQSGEKGQYRQPKPVLRHDVTTMAILAYGHVRMRFTDGVDHHIKQQGDYVLWRPDDPHEFEFLQDTLVITLRW